MADNKTTLPRKAGQEIGKSGTLIFQGYITQEEYNSDLTGARLIEKVEIMRRSSSTVRATLLVVKLPILSADWHVKPATNEEGEVDDKDQEIADYINRELFHRNINFFDFLRQASTHLDFGYSVFEKVYELTDFNGQPRLGLSKLGFRKQNSIMKWEMDDGGEGIHQLVNSGQYDIPREKLVIFTNEKEGDNLEGISLLRFAYKDWDILDKLQIVNAVALEKMSIGVPYTQARENQTPSNEDVQKADEILRNFRANEEAFMNIPASMEVGMLDMKANSTADIIPTLQYHDRRISQAILAQFMDLGGQSGSGSQSLAKDLTSLFMKAEEATAKVMQSVIQTDVIKQLVDLNYSNLENGYPELSFGNISDEDLSQTATSLGTLAEKGLITPDIELEDHLRKRHNLPAMQKESRKIYEQTLKDRASGETTEDTEGKEKPKDKKPEEDKTVKPVVKPKKANPDDVKASLEAAQARAREARQELIDVISI